MSRTPTADLIDAHRRTMESTSKWDRDAAIADHIEVLVGCIADAVATRAWHHGMPEPETYTLSDFLKWRISRNVYQTLARQWIEGVRSNAIEPPPLSCDV